MIIYIQWEIICREELYLEGIWYWIFKVELLRKISANKECNFTLAFTSIVTSEKKQTREGLCTKPKT